MATVHYTRSCGLQLTYEIRINERGSYTICLNGKELLRGRDGLSEGGRHRGPNKRKAAGALHEAKLAIEGLSAMPEF